MAKHSPGCGPPPCFSSVYFDGGQTVTGDSKASGVQSDLFAAAIAMVGHDLRQPLQVITNSHDLLATMLQRRTQRDELARAENATTELATMLGQLVGLLSVRGGFAYLGHERVVLRPLFGRLAVEFTRLAALKGIELRIAPASEVVSSHPMLLSGILRNLIHNAIDYTPSGGHVLVAARRRGARTHIEVRDSGPGIAPDELSKIFEAFYRGDTSRADGLGLGLFIVKRRAIPRPSGGSALGGRSRLVLCRGGEPFPWRLRSRPHQPCVATRERLLRNRSRVSRSGRRSSMTYATDMIERLEELAAWHRMRAENAGSDWVWEARVRTAEDLERRAADLRAQQHRRPAPHPTARAEQRSPANSCTHARPIVPQAGSPLIRIEAGGDP